MSAKKQLVGHLKQILGKDVEDDIVNYVNGIKHREDLDEFMENILNKNNTKHITSYNAICAILFGRNVEKKQSPIMANNNNKTTSKGRKKFMDINSFKEKKKEKEGRSICGCDGQEHEFMNNCLNCGRIHCFDEGPGPCLFCGELITLMGEEAINYQSNNKKQTVARQKTNTVFDDDNDYFKIHNKKEKNGTKEDKRKLVIALDFASRKVIESSEEDWKIRQRLHEDIKKHLMNVDKLYKNLQKQSEMKYSSDNTDLVDLMIKMRHRKPLGVEDLGPEDDAKMHFIDYGKVYDEEIITNSDHGLCLSMHQPYASLLIAGVKKHEGRTWSTNHRGRLWIAAAAKVPDDEEITALELFYRQYYNDESLKFPREYPVSCLLGCVIVEDCLDQENYKKRYPKGESDSPFVLICSNPIILPIFYPIVGKHKIYPLDKELHNCAKLSIRHAKYVAD